MYQSSGLVNIGGGQFLAVSSDGGYNYVTGLQCWGHLAVSDCDDCLTVLGTSGCQ